MLPSLPSFLRYSPDILAVVRSNPDLILASASPRRRELLESLGLVLAVESVDLDESVREGEPVRDSRRETSHANARYDEIGEGLQGEPETAGVAALADANSASMAA